MRSQSLKEANLSPQYTELYEKCSFDRVTLPLVNRGNEVLTNKQLPKGYLKPGGWRAIFSRNHPNGIVLTEAHWLSLK